MASMLDSVDLRTQLVGENRLELLMFRLNDSQIYAVNVFKVQEVQRMPKLTIMPKCHPIVVGITHVRGQTIPVIDLSKAIGLTSINNRDSCNVIISEYNRSTQAFMVGSVDRIINLNWEQVQAPPKGSGKNHFLTSICQVNDEIVEIIDVEKILAQIIDFESVDKLVNIAIDDDILNFSKDKTILVVDDSATAHNQIKSILKRFNINVETASDGAKALDHLQSLADAGVEAQGKNGMLITDSEMPEMDGYRLTSEIRDDPRFSSLFVIMHTSLSGSFNKAMTKKVGVDRFISKFQPDELTLLVKERLSDLMLHQSRH